MGQLNQMRIFTEVVDGEGFTAAANRLGMSRAQVSKSVQQLEAHLGTRLLNRTTRRISLTDTGRIYYERCHSILEEIDEMDEIASQQSSEPSGLLTIGAPNSYGILHLSEAIPHYMKRYPKVEIDIRLTDRLVDVVAEGFDLVIRIAELEDSSLIARPIQPCDRVYCASPEYLERHGTPQTPQELKAHDCLLYTNLSKPGQWPFKTEEGMEMVKVNGPLKSDNGDILRAAAVQGMGVVTLPTFICGPDLEAGRLQTILMEYTPEPISVYAVFPSRRYLSAKVRTFVDFLSEYF